LKVYIVQSTRTLIIHGVFSTREKARKYIESADTAFISEAEVK